MGILGRSLLITTLSCIIMNKIVFGSTADFFPSIKGNLTLVTWDHAVNSEAKLNTALQNKTVMMIEADVLMGFKVNENRTLVPIMAHPPQNQSDLDLETFFQKFNASSNATRKGMKLDFKTTSTLESSLPIIKNHYVGKYPLWINADIIHGPINSTTNPVNASTFFNLTRTFNNTVLSIGWTTNYGSNMTGKYSDSEINAMLSAIKHNNVIQEITFPVRAGLAAESLEQMKTLLKEVPRSTLTIWSSEKDNVNITKLNALVATLGVNRVYVDVPDSLHRQLNFGSTPRSAGDIAKLGILSLVFAFILALM